MEDTNKRKRVLCPMPGKDGKTFWLRMGHAYVNKDNSINLYLDCLPLNGKLQVRDWEDPPWEKKDAQKDAPFGSPRVESQNNLPF